MKLLINGNKVDDVFAPEATLGKVLQSIQDEKVSEHEVISAIWVDGEQLTPEQLSQWKDRPVSDFDEAQIAAPHRNTLASESLRILGRTLGESMTDRHKIVEHLHQGRSHEAMKILPGYLKIWESIHLTLASVCRLLEVDLESLEIYAPTTAQPTSAEKCDLFIDRITSLLNTLAQLKEALKSADLVLLGDIIDYEFADMTKDWQGLLEELANRFDIPN